ncbi:MAG TPA: FAD-dependent oxidoreductase [Micromonosporaceae bacterium]|nr:FAD-dependent oxidoreductase [Micromonosporaceae bacterium]
MTEQFVIVGAGLAGAKAAETLREEGFDGRIVLVGEEEVRPYERPPLSKAHLLGTADLDTAFVHAPDWYAAHDVQLRAGVAVEAIDRPNREVALADGDRIAYDRLLLATGSSPRKLDVPGADLGGVLYLRTMADSESLAKRLVDGAHVVVIGGGWIGLEVAAAARAHGASVTVVEMTVLPLQRVLGAEVARVFMALHEAHGVTFKCGIGVRELRGEADVHSVVLTDGTELPADVVVAGIGIGPNVELAEAAGLDVANGVATDAAMRTTDPFIFAAGDVANSHNPILGHSIRVEHWANALNGGPAAARSMLGQTVSYDRVPYFFSDQYDFGLEYSGYVEPGGYDLVVFRGSTEIVDGKAPEFVAFWLSGGRVLAGMNANVWDAQDEIQRLVRAGYAGSAVDPAALADPDRPLAELG